MSNKVFLYLAIFILSLDSYLRIRGILGLSFLVFYLICINFQTGLSKKFILPLFLLSIGFLVYTLLAYFLPEFYLQIPDDNVNFLLKIIDRFSLIILFFLVCVTFVKVNYIILMRNIAFIHIGYLLFQFFLFYGLGIKFDILQAIGIEQRTSMVYSGAEVYRPAGLYWEPSNFAAYILALYLPYLIKVNNFSKFDYLMPISIVLTLSSVSFIVGSLLFFVMLLKSKVIKK